MNEKFMTIKEEREMRKNKQSVISRSKKWFNGQGYLKNAFAEKLNAIRKTTAVLVGIAVAGQFTLGMLYTGAAAGDPAHLNGSLAVANVTKGGSYNETSVPALVDEVVQFELAIHNTEPPTSGTDAYNVLAKMQMPTTTGTTLTVTGSAQGTNTNLLSDVASVTTQVPANLQYIPGTAKWKHNTGTNENPNWVTQTVSDTVVTTGVSLQTLKPCWNMQQTVTIQARVTGNYINVQKQVARLGGTWQEEVTAAPGEKVAYLISFTNTGNTQLTNVLIGDNLPPYMTYVAGTTKLINPNNPNGISVPDGVTIGRLNVGNYGVGSGGHVTFQVEINSNVPAGSHTLRNVGIADSDQTGEVWDRANVLVNVVQDLDPEFVLSKSALNVTQNVDATTTRAHAGDVIRYTLNTQNVGDEAGEYTINDDISDILQYASITNANGGTLLGNTISFGTHNIGINQTVTRNFEVRVNPVAQWPAAGDTTLTNVYGNNIVVLLGYTVIDPAKSAFNNTQSVNAVTSVARAGDQITYTLVTRNLGNDIVTNHVVSDDISDVLEYATVSNAMGGNVSGGIISWPAQNIPAGGQVTNTFVITVNNEIPTDEQDGTSFDLKMQNTYGNLVSIDIELPVKPTPLPAILGATASRLAAAGAGNVLVFGLMSLMFSTSLFLYVREKYLLERAMRMAA
jgi:uncharacterized repeat protein (TIGR01451 family)